MRLSVHRSATALVIASLFAYRTGRADTSEKMYELSAALTKLSRAVESAVRYGGAPESLSDEELVVLATKKQPGLREPFAAYKLRISRQAGHVVVLVCTQDGRIGLLEDAGCSAKLDEPLWKASPPRPCQFTLSVTKACPVPTAR